MASVPGQRNSVPRRVKNLSSAIVRKGLGEVNARLKYHQVVKSAKETRRYDKWQNNPHASRGLLTATWPTLLGNFWRVDWEMRTELPEFPKERRLRVIYLTLVIRLMRVSWLLISIQPLEKASTLGGDANKVSNWLQGSHQFLNTEGETLEQIRLTPET